jgi:TRAP-type C4-dicarboxylate transport system substrate-binding protein
MAVALTLVATGCGTGSSGDKAGGSGAPVVLRMAVQVNSDTQPDADIIRYLTREALDVSHGKLRIVVTYDAAGDTSATPEQAIGRMVENGRFDLAFIGARAWDELGVNGLRALHAPFLIDNTPLMGRVARAPVAARSMSDLRRVGVVGLALVPIELRHVFGHRPLLSPADYAGVRVRNLPSRTSDALFTALGAVPVHPHFIDTFRLIANGGIDAAEAGGFIHSDLATFSDVVLFPKFDTLVANRRAFARLSSKAQSWLREAGRRAVDRAIGKYLVPDAKVVNLWCSNPLGRVVSPSATQLAELRQAAAPVTAALERDPETRSEIAQIEQLKASTSPGPPAVVPAACSAPKRAVKPTLPKQPAAGHVSSRLDGTYRYILTKADARAHGGPHEDLNAYPLVSTWMLRRGMWRNVGGDNGTYTIVGDRVIFNWKTVESVLRFSFKRDDDGTLHLTPLGRFDPGDRFIWATKPWRRIGPPSLRALKQP